MNKQIIEDLEFIKSVLTELTVDTAGYDFGPAYEFAVERRKLAKTKLNRIIRGLQYDYQNCNH